jgi:hypothetical protein
VPGYRHDHDQERTHVSAAWEWQDITKPGDPDPKFNADARLHLLMSLRNDMSRYLHDNHWTVLRFKRRPLLTTDNPVVMAARPDDSGRTGVEIFTADAFLAPLSRHTALGDSARPPLPDCCAIGSSVGLPTSTVGVGRAAADSSDTNSNGGVKRRMSYSPAIM